MEIKQINQQEAPDAFIYADNNIKIKKAMAIELKKCTGLDNDVIGRVLHLTPVEIDWIFNSSEKEK